VDIKKSVVVLTLACLFICSRPLSVFADRCDDAMAEARRTFHAALDASEEKEFTKAIELYEEAEGYYRSASEMQNCTCRKIPGAVIQNITICRNNVAKIRTALESQGEYEAYN
jgi:hypothetical protein